MLLVILQFRGSKRSHISLCIVDTGEIFVSHCCMFKGVDTARKTLKQGGTVRVRSNSKEVEDELASMRGTKDTGRIAYRERRPIRGICNVEEELQMDAHSAGRPGKDDSADISASRDSSPAPSQHLTKRHTVKSASDKG